MAAEIPVAGATHAGSKGIPVEPPLTLKPRKRWARRIVYFLVAGGLVVSGGAWLLHQPFVGDYALQKIGEFVKDETGLTFEARNIDVALFSGLVTVDDIRLGGDILRIHRLEFQGDLLSLWGDHPNIHRILLLRPEVRLDTKRLARLKFKVHPPRPLPQAKLDFFELKDGSIEIREPEWGLPEAHSTFAAQGKGLGPNRLRVEFKATDMAMKAPGGLAKGHAEITADLSETILRLLKAEVEFGNQKLQASGTFEPKSQRLSAKTKSVWDLASALKLGFPKSKAPTSGQITADLALEGNVRKPLWDLHLQSNNLGPGVKNLHPGKLELKANGNLQEAKFSNLAWHSEDGDIALEGEWKRGLRTKASFHATNVDLNPLAAFSRVGQAKDLQAFFEGEAELPGDPWGKGLRLDLLKTHTAGRIQRLGSNVGDFKASLESGQLNLNALNLHLEDLDIQAHASGRIGPKGIVDLKAEGLIDTDAARVATALQAWNVKKLDMAGRVRATVDLSIHPSEGLLLNGDLGMLNPRWHGASADWLAAKVQIQGSTLNIQNLEVAKGEGRGYGDIWLTWSDLPTDSKQFEACFRASRLPISEGLKAAERAGGSRRQREREQNHRRRPRGSRVRGVRRPAPCSVGSGGRARAVAAPGRRGKEVARETEAQAALIAGLRTRVSLEGCFRWRA